MSTIMGYEIEVVGVDRSKEGVAHRVTMSANHTGGLARKYQAVFFLQNGKLQKGGDKDIPRVILEEMRRQSVAILRENRGVERGRYEKNGSRARARQEEEARERVREAQLDMFDVR